MQKAFGIKLLKFSFVALIIFAIQFLLYFRADPYDDFKVKSNYSWKYSFQSLGDVSTKSLLASKRKHNSFIFGSSRSTGVYACYLEDKIPDSKFFHFASWNETIGGIHRKLVLIDCLKYSIDNVVIYIDTDFTFKGEGKCSELEHYLVLGESKYGYYWKHFQHFFSIVGVDKIKILFGKEPGERLYPNYQSDPIRNDHNHICKDLVIRDYGVIKSKTKYYKKIDSVRNNNNRFNRLGYETSSEKKQISNGEELMLSEIKKIFTKHNTNFKIIITPLYDQVKFHSKDIESLNSIFEYKIYDFSGKNYITDDIYNYADPLHFNKSISKQIIDSVFKNKN
jgi:hypothetical protein